MNPPKSMSESLYRAALSLMPAGVTYGLRYIDPHPFYAQKAKGCFIEDLDGRRMTDYWCGHLAMILGHSHPDVVRAIREQLESGTQIGVPHPSEVELAKKVIQHVPSAEMVRFCTSGTEANMYAVRLARTFTGRDRVGKFEGGWHGGYDSLHVGVHHPFDAPESGGIPKDVLRNTVVLPYNDLEGTRRLIMKEDFACIILEPVLGAGGIVPAESSFLRGLREICEETSTLLIFDEVITGFRLGLGGAQQFYDVLPDLTILGKVLGGGLPIGAIVGRRDLMEREDHTRFSGEDYAFQGGTWTGHPLAMAAGLATLRVLEEKPVYSHIDLLAQKARNGLRAAFYNNGIDVQVTGVGSLFGLHFTRHQVLSARNSALADQSLARRYIDFLRDHGIFMQSQKLPHGGISYAHGQEEVDSLVAVTEEFAKTSA